MTPAWLAFFDGLIALALVGAGIVCAHFGMTPSIIGFQIFLLGFFVSAIGLIMGKIAIFWAALRKARLGPLPRAFFGTVLSALIFLPVANVIAHRRGVPPIN